MDIDKWVQSTNAATLEKLLVDLLLSDGSTYSGYISSTSFEGDPDCLYLINRPPEEGFFVGKKIRKQAIIGFSFSVAPRSNFCVHQIRVCKSNEALHFRHNIHEKQQFLIFNTVEAKDKFNSECLVYLRNLSGQLLPNEKISLVLSKGLPDESELDLSDLHEKVKDFLSE